jgi:hypothetical protein
VSTATAISWLASTTALLVHVAGLVASFTLALLLGFGAKQTATCCSDMIFLQEVISAAGLYN